MRGTGLQGQVSSMRGGDASRELSPLFPYGAVDPRDLGRPQTITSRPVIDPRSVFGESFPTPLPPNPIGSGPVRPGIGNTRPDYPVNPFWTEWQNTYGPYAGGPIPDPFTAPRPRDPGNAYPKESPRNFQNPNSPFSFPQYPIDTPSSNLPFAPNIDPMFFHPDGTPIPHSYDPQNPFDVPNFPRWVGPQDPYGRPLFPIDPNGRPRPSRPVYPRPTNPQRPNRPRPRPNFPWQMPNIQQFIRAVFRTR